MKALTLFICSLSINVFHALNLYDKGCTSDTDCAGVARCLTAGCLGTQCLCPENYMPNDEYTKCLKVIDLGETCGDLNTRCRLPNTRCSNGKCECQAGFIPAVDNKRCKKRALAINSGWALLNESCSSEVLCTEGHTMKCDGVCLCTTNYREATPADLSAFPNSGECVSSSYTLGSDISLYKKHCLTVPEGGLKDIGEECTADTNCPGNATCQQVGCEKKCSCEDGFAPSDDRKNCLKLIPLDKACNADTVCETLHSRCSDEEKGGTCICDYGYEETGASLCRQVSSFPGSIRYATINESCESAPVKINCQADLECTNGICQCDSTVFREASVLERIAFNPEGYCVPIVATLNPTGEKKDVICAEVPIVSSQITQSTASITQVLATDIPMLEPSTSEPNMLATDTQILMPEPSTSQAEIMLTDTQVPMPEPSTSQAEIMPTDTQVSMQQPSTSQAEIMPSGTQVPMPEPSTSQPEIMPTDTQLPISEQPTSQSDIMPTDTQLSIQEPSAAQPEPSTSQGEIMPTDTQLQISEQSTSQSDIMPTDTQVSIQEPYSAQSEPSTSQGEIMPTDTQVQISEQSTSQLDIRPTDTQVSIQESSAAQSEPSTSQGEIMPTDTQLPISEQPTSQLDIMPTERQVSMSATSNSTLDIIATESIRDVSHDESLYTSLDGKYSFPLSSSPTTYLTPGPFTDTVQSSPGMLLVDSTAISIDRTSTMEVSASMYTNDTETTETTQATTTVKAIVGVFDSCVDEAVCPANAECKKSSCIGNKCFCKSGYYPANKDTECLRGVKLGEDCNDTITCSIPFSLCTDGKCVCGPVLPHSTSDGFCTMDMPSVGESCTGNDLCHGMAHCNSTTSLCECDNGYRVADDAEVFSAGPVWYTNGRCIKRVVNEVPKECVIGNIGDTCTGDSNCPKNATCISAIATETSYCKHRCWCDVGFAPSADKKSCLPVIKIGETCDRASNRCINMLSKCIDNKCECYRGFQPAANNTLCKPDDYPQYHMSSPILGETCDNNTNRCFMKGEQVCSTAGKCECREGLRPATDLDLLALYYDMRQCRNESVPDGYRPSISCSDPPVPLIGRPDFDLPDKPSSDLKRNQLIMYVLVPVAVIAAAVLAIIYTAVRRRRSLAQKYDDTSSVDNETNSTSSFHLPRPAFNLTRFRSDQTWNEQKNKYNTPNSRIHKQ